MATSQDKNKQLLCLSHKFTPIFHSREIERNTFIHKVIIFLIPRILSFPPIYFRKTKEMKLFFRYKHENNTQTQIIDPFAIIYNISSLLKV